MQGLVVVCCCRLLCFVVVFFVFVMSACRYTGAPPSLPVRQAGLRTGKELPCCCVLFSFIMSFSMVFMRKLLWFVVVFSSLLCLPSGRQASFQGLLVSFWLGCMVKCSLLWIVVFCCRLLCWKVVVISNEERNLLKVSSVVVSLRSVSIYMLGRCLSPLRSFRHDDLDYLQYRLL